MPTSRTALRSIARHTRGALFGLGNLAADQSSSWDAMIFSFQEKRRQLDSAETELIDVRSMVTDDADLTEWQSAMEKVIAAKTGMDAVAGAMTSATGAYQSAVDWTSGIFEDVFGLDGVRQSAKRRGLFGLGALPIAAGTLAALIAAATVAASGAFAYSSYIRAKYSLLSQQETQKYIAERTDQLIEGGTDPQRAADQAYREAKEQATERANQEAGTSFGGRLEKMLLIGAVIAGIIVLGPQLSTLMKRR